MRLGKSFKIFSGFKINVSKKGISSTIGTKGFSINTGSQGTFINTNIPGTGISHRQKITKNPQNNKKKDTTIDGAVLLGGIIGALLFFLFNSLILFLLPIFVVPLIIIFSPKEKNNIQNIAPITNNENISKIIVNKIIIQNDNEFIPVGNMITSLYPNQYGLYPHEILVLYLLPDKNNHPKYWFYRYHVQNLPEVIQSLINRNFIVFSISSKKEIIGHYKITELRNLLKKYEIKSPKKKDDVIQTILDNIPHDEIEKLITTCNITGHYMLSSLGQEAIKDDEYVLYTHKHNYDEFDIYSLNRIMAGDTKNYKQYIMEIFTKKCSEYLKTNQYNNYRHTKFHISEFLAEEGQILQAIKSIAEIIYIDLNDLSDSNYSPDSESAEIIGFYLPVNNLSSGIIGRLCEYKEKLKLGNEQLINILFEVFTYASTYSSLQFHIFTETECVKITLSNIDNNTQEIINIHKQVKQRLQEKYPKIKFYD